MSNTMSALRKLDNALYELSDTIWTNIGKKLADISGDEVKQKEYLIKDILYRYNQFDSTDPLEVKDRDLSSVDFSDKKINNVKFINCNLSGANFSNTVFHNVDFENTYANYSDFHNAEFWNCNMKMSYFNNSNLQAAHFSSHSMNKDKNVSEIYTCSFKSANLSRADLFKANIDNCDFRNSDLSLTDFGSFSSEFITNIVRCDFRETNLDFSDIENAIEDCEVYKKLDKKINNYLDNGDFTNAYISAIDEANYNDKIFTDMVIERCGADTDTLQNAINAMVAYKDETPEYGAKLLNDVLKSDMYKANFKDQTQTKEAVLV